MKTALEKLRELREHDSSIVAIARDEDGSTYSYQRRIPESHDLGWSNGLGIVRWITETVIFDSDDWQSCIVTYKDLENFDIETITISKAEYDRLLTFESKLNEIMKILEK